MRLRATRLLAAALLGATVACTGAETDPASADSVAARAAAYLWSRQAQDGGWHSETYALLRPGHALTPFVLLALLDAPASAAAPPPGAVERALAFLRRALDDRGRLGHSDPDVLEYPNYATAYALRCFARVGEPSDRPRIRRMAEYLRSQQYGEENGFRPADLAYGGWGFGGTHRPGVPGPMDLAHTRRVLEALCDAGALGEGVGARAESFLRLLQRHASDGRPQPTVSDAAPASESPYDGSFYFSPVSLAANKGPVDGPHPRGYATATADGLLALLAAGVPADDERVTHARDWLRRHPGADRPAGVAEQPTPWRSAVHHYHLAVRAEVERALREPSSWRARAAPLLAPHQRPDGSFANPNALMKEDDPILCTALALIALS